MSNKLIALTLVFSGLQAAALNAGKPPFVPPPIEGIFGSEFTVTYDGKVSEEKRVELVNHLRKHLIADQPEGAKFKELVLGSSTSTSNEKFESPNKWWLQVTKNPGVIEFKKKPMTIKETKRFKSDIQDAIFASSAAVGLFPWDYLGGGHLNMDTNIFGNNVRLARNFVVDFWNHNELAMGILNYDTNNAMPFQHFTYDVQRRLMAVIHRADMGGFTNTMSGVQDFFSALDYIQNNAANVFGTQAKGKHHDLNFSHRGRVEIRCVRPQPNMDVWVNQIELIEGRINNYLRLIEEPIPYKMRVPITSVLNIAEGDPTGHRYVPPINPQLALRNFHQYVTESHLDWRDHRGYVWPPWARGNVHVTDLERGSELEKFEKTEFFIVRDRMAKLRNRARTYSKCNAELVN